MIMEAGTVVLLVQRWHCTVWFVALCTCTYLVLQYFSSGGYSKEIMYQEVAQSVGHSAQEI